MQHCAGSEPRCCRSCSCHSRVRRYLLLHSSGHQSVGSQWALSPADRLEASRKLAGAFSGWRSACARTRAPVGRWDTVLGRHLNPFRMFDECPLSTQFVTWPPNAGRSGSRPAANDPIAEVAIAPLLAGSTPNRQASMAKRKSTTCFIFQQEDAVISASLVHDGSASC